MLCSPLSHLGSLLECSDPWGLHLLVSLSRPQTPAPNKRQLKGNLNLKPGAQQKPAAFSQNKKLWGASSVSSTQKNANLILTLASRLTQCTVKAAAAAVKREGQREREREESEGRTGVGTPGPWTGSQRSIHNHQQRH